MSVVLGGDIHFKELVFLCIVFPILFTRVFLSFIGTIASLYLLQTRDMKLLPMNMRKIINIRRTARKKISERITALSGLHLLLIILFICCLIAILVDL